MTQGIPIPVTIEGNDALVMLARIVNALEHVGDKAQAASPKTDHLAVSLRGVGEAARHINEVRELVTTFAESLINAAERVGQFAGEQQRLDANSARMALNFQQAADSAGGFVSEMQTMTLATSLANRGIRVTQNELDSLARIGMARAVDAGKNVEEVFDSIADSVVEGGEELEKFGTSLHSVADDSHTASERLSALVARGNETARAMRTSADSVALFREELQRAGRYASTGFVDEMARLRDVTGTMRQGATDAVEFRREMEAIGRTAALMVTGIGNAVGLVIGGIATSVSLMVAGIAAAQAGIHALATRGNAAAAARAAFESFGTRDVAEFTRNRATALAALFAEQNSRTTAPAEAAAAPTPDMVVTRDEVSLRGGAASRGSRETAAQRRAREQRAFDELMGRAFERTGPRAELPGVVREQTAEQLRASGERERESLRESREAQQRKGREAYERSDEGARAQVERERVARREERLLERRRDSYRTLTDELEEMSNQRMSVARQEAESVTSAFRSMGQAVATHLVAVLQGKEELGTALQAMLSETLSAISQEATVKAGLNLAEGFAALATYRYDAAATHFAAAGIFTAVAAATGVAGAALAPQASAGGAQAQGGRESRDRSAAPMSAGAASGASSATVINVAFNGPQFGTGGVVQAARQLAGVLNAGAVQGGVQLNRLAIPAGVR